MSGNKIWRPIWPLGAQTIWKPFAFIFCCQSERRAERNPFKSPRHCWASKFVSSVAMTAAGRWLCVFILTKKIHLHLCAQNAPLFSWYIAGVCGMAEKWWMSHKSQSCLSCRSSPAPLPRPATRPPASARSRGDDDDAYDDDASNNIPQLCAAPRLILI